MPELEVPGDIEFTPEGPSLGTVSVSADFSFTITAETTGDTCGEDVVEMTVVAGEEQHQRGGFRKVG